MLRRVFGALLGRKLPNHEIGEQKFNVFWGTALLASDPISSVAYATEEILWILFPVIGAASYILTPRISLVIVLLQCILIFSYRQTVAAYPNGGGSYIVASDNLGRLASLVAAASLAVDYTLTVAVSIAAGTAAIYSAFPQYPVLFQLRVLISLGFIVLLAIGNLRGVKDSSRIFGVPTYLFVFAIVILIGAGIVQFYSGHYSGHVLVALPAVMPHDTLSQAVFVYLVLRAFSSGAVAMTGIEAISNGVPAFRPPSSKNAQKSYMLLGIVIFLTIGGMALLAQVYHTVPNEKVTVVAQLAYDVFGMGPMFYVIQFTTTIVLAMAANAAFAGFPMLFAVVAQDRFAPRQLALRGHRLSFNNGIVVVAVMASLLIIAFGSSTDALIPLYSLGVFTAFTLSQAGMFRRWLKLKSEGWHWKAAINGLGAVMTGITVIIVAGTKFLSGAWIVVLVIPALVFLMLRIHRHYVSVAKQLDIPNDELGKICLEAEYAHHVIIPVDSLNAMVVKSLRYAKAISSNVVAIHIAPYSGEADKLRRKWELLKTDIPLVIKESPYREVVRPLLEYIQEDHASAPGDKITILLPQFVVTKLWEVALHNNTSVFIANSLLKERDIVIAVLPFHLGDRAGKCLQVPETMGPIATHNLQT